MPRKTATKTKRPSATVAEAKVRAQRQAFVEHYLETWNATEAAKRAGYSTESARQQGSRLLTNVDIRDAIEARLSAIAMGPNEVLARLGDHARASLDDMLDRSNSLDLNAARANGKLHLIKKIKRREWYDQDGNRTVTTEVELHDAQAALVHLGRKHKLFGDRLEHTGADGGPVTLKVVYDDPPGA